ncbi:unnamed protein product [Schistocephalus solidus]|uniref:Uncharacterized protein n=1 Tax=Schistocephalus solidus TaxID=70667 RepID=A0A183S8W2_SCHSO|nr:unnamed protein product [Schistocephalus solidus]
MADVLELHGENDFEEDTEGDRKIITIFPKFSTVSFTKFCSRGTTLLTEKLQILKRWAEHFRSVLTCSSAITDGAIDRLPQVDMNNDLDVPPSLPETIRAVQQISSGKAPGSDAIPPEVYKHGGPRLMAELTTLFQMWRQGQVPQDFKDATIVHLYKRKGNRQLCDNHRRISLLNITGKIFARIKSITFTIIETTSQYSSPVTPTTAVTTSDVDSPKLSSMRPHIHLMHRPGRSLANPSYRDR